MNLILIAAFFAGWQGLLFNIAVVCVVFWGIMQLAQWAGWPIPRPVQIIAVCLVTILLIYWLFQLFNMLMA